MICAHKNFTAQVDVNRLEDTGRFSADVKVWCVECRLPFRFIGLRTDVISTKIPCMSPFGEEARLPLEPIDMDGPIHPEVLKAMQSKMPGFQ